MWQEYGGMRPNYAKKHADAKAAGQALHLVQGRSYHDISSKLINCLLFIFCIFRSNLLHGDSDVANHFLFTRIAAAALTAGLLCSAPPARADVSAEISTAYHLQNYARVLELARPLAAQGNVSAQYYLGMLYKHGMAVEQNSQTARQWLEKAAAQGHVQAQYHLGEMYAEGWGIKKNLQTAIEWYEKAAERSHTPSMLELGALYTNTPGVKQDLAAALKWYTKAASLGNAAAQFRLGKMYHDGRGIARNLKTARQWYEKSAAQGYSRAIRAVRGLDGGK